MANKPTKYFYILFLLTCLFLSACASNKVGTLQHCEISELNDQSDNNAYIIGVGDKISVKFFFNSALNDEVIIRPDGKISLQLIDEVQAAGLTTKELDSVLTNAYAKTFKTSSNKYSLAVSDHIAIKSYYHDKLNDEVIIRPDGKISLQLIGEVKAAGFTPAELDTLLTEKYSAFFDSPDLSVIAISSNHPDLTVIVNEFSSQKIYVGGEVTHPRIIKFTGKLRILDVIIQAAGPLDSGNLSQVILMRRSPTGEPEVYYVNIKDVLHGQSADVWLKPYDIVYVPKTTTANIEYFVRTYLWDLLPDQLVFSFFYNLKPEIQVEK